MQHRPRALFIRHDPDAHPGYVGGRLAARGFENIDLAVAPSLDESNPSIEFGDPGEYDLIIPLGSIWSVYDTKTIGNWIGAELEFLAEAHRRDVPMLGICFGGQALAAALGGTVSASPVPEVGWRMISSDRPDVIAEGPWMQWHYDRFTVPAGATEIARNEIGPQAFVKDRTVGLQFHPEVSTEIVHGWLDGAPAELIEGPEIDVPGIRADTTRLAPAAKARTERIIDWFLDDVCDGALAPAFALQAVHMPANTSGLSQKPLIGLPGRRRTAAQVTGFPESLHGLDIDLYLADYSRSVLAAGGLPVHIPMDGDPQEYLSHLHGIVLTGGADVSPQRYDAEPDGNGDYEPDRDALELTLMEASLQHDLPVLGICRGLQILNVHAGGTLSQHVPEHARYDVSPDSRVHEIRFEPASRLGLLYTGAPGRDTPANGPVSVNSLHHQIVDRVGEGLKVAATDEDGVVEGLELPGRDVMAVQWHPEMLTEPEPVFTWLVSQSRKRIPA